MESNKPGLTKREKTLIFIVAVVALLAGAINFALIPLNARLNDARAELGDLETERARIESLLALEPGTRRNYEEALEQYNALRDEIPGRSQSSEVGRMLTNLCINHGLDPTDQRLSEPEVYMLVKPVTDPETGELTDKTTQEETPFYVITARMGVKGDYGSLKRLLDEVGDIPYIRVTRVSFSESRDRNQPSAGRTDTDDPDAAPAPVPVSNPYDLTIDTVSIDFEVTILGFTDH